MTRELAEANPNLLIETCLEVEAGRVIALSEVWKIPHRVRGKGEREKAEIS